MKCAFPKLKPNWACACEQCENARQDLTVTHWSYDRADCQEHYWNLTIHYPTCTSKTFQVEHFLPWFLIQNMRIRSDFAIGDPMHPKSAKQSPYSISTHKQTTHLQKIFYVVTFPRVTTFNFDDVSWWMQSAACHLDFIHRDQPFVKSSPELGRLSWLVAWTCMTELCWKVNL